MRDCSTGSCPGSITTLGSSPAPRIQRSRCSSGRVIVRTSLPTWTSSFRCASRASSARRRPGGRSAADTHAEVRKQTLDLTARQAKLWKRELRPALAEAGVNVGDVEDCTPKELDLLEGRFDQEIFPILTPLAVGP